MIFSILLYLSLAICVFGLIFRFSTWFRSRIGPEAGEFSSAERLSAAIRCVALILFSGRIVQFIKAFLLDVLLQLRILREDPRRWFMHTCILVGFMLLLLMHALDRYFSAVLFSGYEATLNPFLFLRNLFGVLVIFGLVAALIRRRSLPILRIATLKRDWYALVILAVIMLSGFLLEGAKIVSEHAFQRMIEDYSMIDDEDDENALKVYWTREYGAAFGDLARDANEDALELGRELHEENCADCHSKPASAFVSYSFSRLFKPVARLIDAGRLDLWLYWIHVLACFFGLAYLPFSKFFHIFSTPIKLLSRSMDPKEMAKPVNVLTMRALDMDSCTRCGQCSLNCSVSVVAQCLGNRDVLPSEKLVSSMAYSSGKQFPGPTMHSFQEGSFICTSCYRCTEICPIGINLQDLWEVLKDDLTTSGFDDPQAWTRRQKSSDLAARLADREAPVSMGDKVILAQAGLSAQAGTFSSCFECQTCTNVCPVAANYENPAEALDLMPHQIMHSLGLGMSEMALGSRMIWDCVTCYQCQENCPQGVRVTDVLYELKNLAYGRLREEEGMTNGRGPNRSCLRPGAEGEGGS